MKNKMNKMNTVHQTAFRPMATVTTWRFRDSWGTEKQVKEWFAFHCPLSSWSVCFLHQIGPAN